MTSEPEPQTAAAKRAESQRPHHGDSLLRQRDLSSMHRERANAVLRDLDVLRRRGVVFNPFLEVGAGSVQRSAALINTHEVDGVATDISVRSLQDAPYILKLLDYRRLPLLVSCDAHHLPFRDNTFRFVFSYQTLHHFSNPVPVLSECYRVLGRGGYLYFNEEPMDSVFRRLLRGNRVLSHPPTRLQRMAYRMGVEKLFWDDGAKERALGMTEARFDLALWRQALRPFRILELEVNRKLQIRSDLYKPALSAVLAGLIGGNVKALCVKDHGQMIDESFRSRFVCLDCGSSALSGLGGPTDEIRCEQCARVYPVVGGVIRMLPRPLEADLYPVEGTQR